MAANCLYYGTDDEMRLGDRIAIRSMGSETVCFVTDIREGVREETESDGTEYAFQTDDGIVHVVEGVSSESSLQIGKNIRLLCRSGCEIEVAAEFIGGSNEKKTPVSWWDIFSFTDFGCGTFTAIGLVAALAGWLLV